MLFVKVTEELSFVYGSIMLPLRLSYVPRQLLRFKRSRNGRFSADAIRFYRHKTEGSAALFVVAAAARMFVGEVAALVGAARGSTGTLFESSIREEQPKRLWPEIPLVLLLRLDDDDDLDFPTEDARPKPMPWGREKPSRLRYM